jgi:pSer/pThr/pTyr-binding forkhead associated (FHA) protein
MSTSQGFRVNDLGSTNGTYVNDKRVTNSDLIDNDSVRLGRVNFKFKSMS